MENVLRSLQSTSCHRLNSKLSYTFYSETGVKVIDLSDTTAMSTLEGHKKAVRQVTWHPSGSLLVGGAFLVRSDTVVLRLIDHLGCRWKSNCLGCIGR